MQQDPFINPFRDQETDFEDYSYELLPSVVQHLVSDEIPFTVVPLHGKWFRVTVKRSDAHRLPWAQKEEAIDLP